MHRDRDARTHGTRGRGRLHRVEVPRPEPRTPPPDRHDGDVDDTALIRVSPEAYNAVIGTYKNPIMGVGELALVGAIAYHAYNGLRIILVDFWSWATRHQRQLWWGVLGLWAVTMLGFAPRHLINVFSHATGGGH